MCRVVKVGGSLLDLPDLPVRLRKWTDSESPGLNLFVVGGGEMIDAIRKLDSIHRFDATQVHWWCVRLLSTSAALLSSLIPEWQVLQTDAEVRSVLRQSNDILNEQTPKSYILDTGLLYTPEACQPAREDESIWEKTSAVELPHDWTTTTDSIAAWMCCRFAVDELVLLKSVDVEGGDWETHAESGFVDAAFPRIAPAIERIRVFNLRDA